LGYWFSDEVAKYPVEFFRKTRRLLLLYFGAYNLQRLEINVRSDYLIGKRFAEKLGFEPEGIMRKYGFDGSDYILYARVS
jgi:RimJ/RimL family protein N-acetyltransferase